jgi:antiviral defense system Shedu protein SduA
MLGGVPLDLQWDVPLRHRRGAAKRLAAIDVYYDFNWSSFFRDGRAQFRNGQCLAEHLRAECPSGKTPALLLMDRSGVKEGVRETPLHYVVVLNPPRYLEHADGDAAMAYLAGTLGSGITGISQLSGLADAQQGELQALFELRLNAEHIAAWAAGNEDRIAQLRSIAGEEDRVFSPANAKAAVAALQELTTLDLDVVRAFVRLLQPADRTARVELLRALTDDTAGRHVTAEVLGQRASERLEDARQATAEYAALVADPHSNETTLQRFIEKNIWLLGLDYARLRPQPLIPRGTVDFLLERFDGCHDLLELKDPRDPIVVETKMRRSPPSASAYSLSPDLAQAIAQVHVYRDVLRHDVLLAEQYGLPNSRDPRVIIVIGSADSMPDYRLAVLRELNKSLHRVEIVPYDVLGKRATAALANVERHLLVAGQVSA